VLWVAGPVRSLGFPTLPRVPNDFV
jgi:hypothetical protein